MGTSGFPAICIVSIKRTLQMFVYFKIEGLDPLIKLKGYTKANMNLLQKQ